MYLFYKVGIPRTERSYFPRKKPQANAGPAATGADAAGSLPLL